MENIFKNTKDSLEVKKYIDSVIIFNHDNSLINDPIWNLSAQSIISGLMSYCLIYNKTTVKDLLDLAYLNRKDLVKKLKQELKNPKIDQWSKINIEDTLHFIKEDTVNSSSFLENAKKRLISIL